ncbi:hypothetical protein NDU88_002116 [Pleurodeles waltl]|uniref:Uncharacterized protein n=1 Tax=Pleurodeles waltl TaxID=8319 RepID=A0AAV7SCB1_PLEWA|nr:hypothetical protein NDU88_002116 [Pleurodeles waltl]
MCQPDALILESRPRWNPDEAPGGRLRHWGRAALELRRVRRGSARIPLQGNPGSASTSKVPGKASQEPGSAVTCAFSESFKKARTDKFGGTLASFYSFMDDYPLAVRLQIALLLEREIYYSAEQFLH